MASTQSFVEFVCEQAASTELISYKKMFGEYAIYFDEKVVALVCDDQVFVKPTVEGSRMLQDPKYAPPYPGAKPHLCVSDQVDDRTLMASLFSVTAHSLPKPKPKKERQKRPAKKS